MNFEISPRELKTSLENQEPLILLDVRQPEEFAFANIGGTLIPLGDLPGRLAELAPEHWIVVYCHHGIRSARAVEFLRQMGYPKAQNLAGGIERWSTEIDPSLPRY